jgi:hypothetical protein
MVDTFNQTCVCDVLFTLDEADLIRKQ